MQYTLKTRENQFKYQKAELSDTHCLTSWYDIIMNSEHT